MKNDVIACISTPLGRGAVSIVRMSGQGCKEKALQVFSSANLTESNLQARYMYFGKLNLGEVFEECLMVYFKAPFSYTGEDVIEFQVHGGVLLCQKVLDVCLKTGARLAQPGEFSKRAFLNGKISLDKAEAIIGEIEAETEGELKSSLQVTNGVLAEKIWAVQQSLTTILAELEVGMDYRDETEETKLKSDIFERLKNIENDILQILKQSESAKYLKNGINVALVGKANVGKSSVMNALLGENRAIVTDIRGTTRDAISESFWQDGIKINLVDTAGIRKTQDVVESLGIERSKQSLNQADIVLFVIDGSEKQTQEDAEIESLLVGKNVIYAINKTDKPRLAKAYKNEIEISAQTGKNIQLLKQRLLQMVHLEKVDANALVLTNSRHTNVLQQAAEVLKEIFETNQISLDILSMLVKKVWQVLGKITGNTENEDIINLIFSKFCLGK